MEIGLDPPKKVPLYAHPNVAIVNTVIGLIFGILSVWFVHHFAFRVVDIMGAKEPSEELFEILWPLRAPWISLGMGIGVGLPMMLIEKRMLKSNVSFYADFFMMPILSRLRWSVQTRNLLVSVPIIIGPMIAVGLCCVSRVAPWPAFFGT